MDRVKKHGYVVAWKSVLASNCGVGQKRNRLITIGVRSDIAIAKGIKTSNDVLKLFPDNQETNVTLKDVLFDIDINPVERDFLLRNCRVNSNYELLQLLPKDPSKPMKMIDIDPSWKLRNSDFTLIRASWNSPSPTLTCRGQQLGVSGVHHPDEDRKFTISELKRITSLPDDFNLTGTFNQKAERIGNMVPSLMIKAIATSLYEKVLA